MTSPDLRGAVKRRRWGSRAGAVAVLAAMVVGGCGDDGGAAPSPVGGADREIVVEDVTVVEPAGSNSAAYLTIRNEGPDHDRLVEVRSPAARAELHETRADDDGLMRMHPVDAVELHVGTAVRFEPGGLHVMLFDIADLEVGDTTPLELVFEHGAPLTVEATIRTHAELIG